MIIICYDKDKIYTYAFIKKGLRFWLKVIYCLIKYEEMSVVKE